ncbi:MAG: hypothetical protein BGO41_06230 [Clostridiales bacterium 38-18]|nr:MAG: hypothetical protein BGO41_06230 [Clostridiales bacterium 38-18]
MIGVALEGGGAKGAFHVGALKALKECGIQYDGVVGTSIGAINGAFAVMDQLDALEQIWLSTTITDIIDGDPTLLEQIAKNKVPLDPSIIKRMVDEIVSNKGFNISPLKDKLTKLIDEHAIRKSNKDFGLVSVSLSDLKPIEVFVEQIPVGELHDYILASASLPTFQDHFVNGKRVIDGAFYDNLPISLLLKKNYDVIYAVRVFGMGRMKRISKKDRDKVIYIEPSDDLGKVLEIDQEKAKKHIDMGYFDTMRVLRRLYGKRYYVSNMPKELDVLAKLVDLKPEVLKGIQSFIGSSFSSHRMLFEELLPLIADLLKVERSEDYGSLILSYYEFLAEQAGINRFEIIAYEDLVSRVDAYYSMEQQIPRVKDELSKLLINAIPNRGFLLFPKNLRIELLIHLYMLVLKPEISHT